MIDFNTPDGVTIIHNPKNLKLFAIPVFHLTAVELEDDRLTRYQAKARILFVVADSPESASRAGLLYSEHLEKGERMGSPIEVPSLAEMAESLLRLV